MVCSASKAEEGLDWNQVLKLFTETEDKAILSSFPCIKDDNVFYFLYNINNMTTIGDKNISIEKADKINIFNNFIKQHINNEQYFSRIVEYIKESRLK